MNGIEKIRERILSDSQAEIDKLTAETDSRVAQIEDEYRKQAHVLAAEAAERAEKAAARQQSRLENAADMERGKTILACKQACIDEAFSRAEAQLTSLSEADYAAVLGKIAAASGTGQEEIILSAADAEKIGAQVVEQANRISGAHFTLSSENRSIGAGLILKQGAVEINCTFGAALRLLRQEMAADIAAILFS